MNGSSIVWNDSSLDALDRNTNESHSYFARPVVGVRKARRLRAQKSSKHRTGDFPIADFSRVSPASVIAQGFSDHQKARALATSVPRTNSLKRLSRVKEIEMKVNGVLPVEPQKAISEEEKRKAWLHTESRLLDLKRTSPKREGKSLLPPPESCGRSVQQVLKLKGEKRMCSKCKVNEAFWSADWCNECMTEFVKEDQE